MDQEEYRLYLFMDGRDSSRRGGHPLAFILLATYDHHREHLEKLAAWLEQHGNAGE